MLIFSIFDSKAGYFHTPHFIKSRGDAVRSFIESANDKTHFVGKHPEDYCLFELGCFDDLSGIVTVFGTPKSLGIASSMIYSVPQGSGGVSLPPDKVGCI